MAVTEGTEFERFGPWIDSVQGPDDVPRLYREAAIDFARIRAAIKVPRNIERRQATASMDLYDQLLYLTGDQLVVLARTDVGYTRQTVDVDGIVAIEEGANLLDGRLVIHAADGSVIRVPFNGSSRGKMADFVDLMRPATVVSLFPAVQTRQPLRRGELGAGGEGIIANYRDLERAEPDLRLLAASPQVRARPSSRLHRALDQFRPRALQPIVLATNDRELIVLSRTQAVVDANEPAVSELRRIIMLGQLQEVVSIPHPRYDDLRLVTMRLGNAALELACSAESEVLATLESLH